MTEDTPAPIHISVVLDRSGSMRSVADDTVGGFNQFLAEQRGQRGDARLTLVQFDSEDAFEVLISGADLSTVPDLNPAAYQPRAWTPLYDAVGQMIAAIDAVLSAKRSRLSRISPTRSVSASVEIPWRRSIIDLLMASAASSLPRGRGAGDDREVGADRARVPDDRADAGDVGDRDQEELRLRQAGRLEDGRQDVDNVVEL